MDRDEQAGAPRPIDLEATVAKNVRRLRESRGLTQQQLGSALALHGLERQGSTVAQLEWGTRPLRLNEVALIAAYFDVPIESLWEDASELLHERLIAAQAADYYTQQRVERLREK